MWTLTKKAWFSVVAYNPKKDPRVAAAAKAGTKLKPHVVSDQTHLLVRTRVKLDLEQLRSVVPSLVIYEDIVADYRYRAVISRKAFKVWLGQKVDQIDYSSHVKEEFRDGITETQGKDAGTDRYTAAFSIWSAWNRLQPWKQWSGKSSKGKYGGTYDAAEVWGDWSGADYGSSGVMGKPKTVSPVQVDSVGVQHEWSDLRTEEDFDRVLEAKVLNYEDAARALGMAPATGFELDLHDLRDMLRETDTECSGKWYLDIQARDLDILSEEAFLLAQYLLDQYGHGGEISVEIFDEAQAELFDVPRRETVDQEEASEDKPDAEIHSLPLDVDPTN